MKYECPSCYLNWEDTQKPIDRRVNQTCRFCVLKNTESELLHWQVDHLDNIPPKHFPKIIKNLYNHFSHKIKQLEIKSDE